MKRSSPPCALILMLGLFATRTPLAAQTNQLGSISFPTSGMPEAQEQFTRGVLLLHSFEYEDAAESFRQAQQLDPDFALAYWGEAMAYNHPVWMEQDLEGARAVLQRLGPTPEARLVKAPTAREKDYLRAVDVLYGQGDKESRDGAYAAAMRELREAYPDDLEAAAFYALSLLGTSHGGRDIPTYMRAAAVVEEVFHQNPHHPGAAHYLIHSYDDPIHAPLGLRAARAYSKIAPAASHAQHMTSHIFTAMGMWDDVVSANETAWSVADERARRKNLPVDARNFHALYWLEYAYLQQGRYADAQRMLEIMRTDAARSGSQRTRGYLAHMRAAYIVDTRRYDAAADINVQTSDLGIRAAATDLFVMALGLLDGGDRAGAEGIVERMAARRQAVLEAGGEQITAVQYVVSRSYTPAVQAAEILEMELQAVLLRDEGRHDAAVELLKSATAKEDNMPFEFGPPFVAKPSHELLGDLLLELGRAEEAFREYESSLARTPRRASSLLGLARAATASGKQKEALAAYADLHEIWHSADADVPELDEVSSARR